MFLTGDEPWPEQIIDADELEVLCHGQHYVEVLERARRGLKQELTPWQCAVAYCFAGRALLFLGRPDEASEHLAEACARFELLSDPWLAAEARDWEAMAQYAMEGAAALPTAEDALARYRLLTPRRPDVEARMVEHLGTVHLARRDYEAAEACYEEALRLAGSLRDLGRLVRIYHGLSRCAWSRGARERALDLARKSLSLASVDQELGPVGPKDVLARVENDLGMMLMHSGQLGQAEDLFRSARQHFAKAGSEAMESHVLLSLGGLRERQGRLDEAVVFVRTALDLARRTAATRALGSAHQQLGELHERLGQPQLADGCFRRALDTFSAPEFRPRRDECQRAYERILAARAGEDSLEEQTGA
jgi:tetratricopeptide (TPR) repeat protein